MTMAATGRYDFELLVDGAVAASRRAVPLSDLKAAWPHVSAMAADAPRGAKIRVLDKDGRIVILTGVVAARILSSTVLAA
jgi:hypothetical protein